MSIILAFALAIIPSAVYVAGGARLIVYQNWNESFGKLTASFTFLVFSSTALTIGLMMFLMRFTAL
jgi:hypothetical protein